MKTKKYEPPRTNLVPLNGRIYCAKVQRIERKRESGIIQIMTFQVPDHNDNPVTVEYNRFIVIAVAEDVLLRVPDNNGTSRKLRWGDEVFPMENPDATGWTLPIVTDFEDERKEYYVLHESEIIGFNASPEIMIESIYSTKDKDTKPEKPLLIPDED